MIEMLINNIDDKSGLPEKDKKKLKMYPNRPTEGLEEPIDQIKKLLGTEESVQKQEILCLSDEEKQKLYQFESKLFDKLKPAYDLDVELQTFYPEYFLTPEGKDNWEKILGESLNLENEDDIKKYLLKNRRRLHKKALENRNIKESARKKSIKYANDKIKDTLTKLIGTKDESIGELSAASIKDLKYPERVSVVSDHKGLLNKISGYFNFRNLLLKEIDHLKYLEEKYSEENVGADSRNPKLNLIRAKLTVTKIYHKKVNVLLAGLYEYGVALKAIQKETKLSGAEKKILKYFSGLDKPEKNLSRIDKYKHGIVSEKPLQVGTEILKFLDGHRVLFQENEMKKYSQPEIFADKKNGIPVESFENLANKLLEKLDLKTKDDTSKISNKQKASDNRWRIVVDETKNSMGVDSKAKIIYLDNKKKSIYSTFCVMMAHEFIHVYQKIMKEDLKDVLDLKIISEIGGDRSTIFSEAGAKMMEDKMSQDLFGLKNLPHPHYLAAMQARLAGENYFGCVKAYYDSALENNKYIMTERIKNGEDLEKVMIDFKKKNIANMDNAVSRTKRLFRPNVVSLNSKDPYLTSSKDMVYLEQLQLVENLAKHDLEFLTLIGGLNLENIVMLTEIGLITPETINTLKDKTKDIQKKLFKNIKEIYTEYMIEKKKREIENSKVKV